MTITYEQIRQLPKAELHVHLDGCLRPETMLDLAREQGIDLPARDPHTLAGQMFVGDASSLEEYLQSYDLTLSVMQSKASLERVAHEFMLDSVDQNIRYIEVRYCPALHQQQRLTIVEAIEAPLAGLHRGSSETGIRFGLIICALRTLRARVSEDLARAAVDYATDGVVAFDLAGSEAGHPARDHAKAFEYARSNDLACTCHAGEGAGAESIDEAIHVCHAQRIGHGTRLKERPEVEEYVRENHIPLEVCLSSNRHTHTVPVVSQHPIRRYFDLGCLVTINTDSRLMDRTTLTDEYWLAHEELGFSTAEIHQLVLNGFEAAFLPPDDRRELIATVKHDLENRT
ncbi:MAG: adenosine deaminase [Gemmatimonadales bacterium]